MTTQEKLRRINERLFAAQKMVKEERGKTARLRAALVRILVILQAETAAGTRELSDLSDHLG